MTHQSFFYDTSYAYKLGGSNTGTHPTACETSGEGARQKESTTLLLELPRRSGGSVPQERIPPALVAEAVGKAAGHDLKMCIEVDDDTQAHAPCNGVA